MPPKTSKKIKELQLELQLHDKQLARAMDYARKHPSESKAKVAKAFGVKAGTLRKRCRGITQPRSIAYRKQQLLTAGEEEAVVDWCRRMSDYFFPVTMLMLVSMAVAILKARASESMVKIIPGIHWGCHFLSRNPSIKLKYCQYLEKVRAKVTATIEEQQLWYRTLRTLMRQHKIIPDNLWNCDEKGIIMGLAVGRQKAIVRANSRSKVARTDGYQEFCSVLETINAAGHVIPPFIVWANKVHCIGFYGTKSDARPATFSRLPSGYMDDDLGLDYIVKHFNIHTTPQTPPGTLPP